MQYMQQCSRASSSKRVSKQQPNTGAYMKCGAVHGIPFIWKYTVRHFPRSYNMCLPVELIVQCRILSLRSRTRRAIVQYTILERELSRRKGKCHFITHTDTHIHIHICTSSVVLRMCSCFEYYTTTGLCVICCLVLFYI